MLTEGKWPFYETHYPEDEIEYFFLILIAACAICFEHLRLKNVFSSHNQLDEYNFCNETFKKFVHSF